MSGFTIEEFWKRRIGVNVAAGTKTVVGWNYHPVSTTAFLEPPLTLNKELSKTADPASASVILVSAAGAVGKSTLARQIAHATSATYIDLAQAGPVGANTLSGGLLKSGLLDAWQKQATTVLIDGLDEARFRVTQDAFAAFVKDIADVAQGRKVPIVLFGRTGAIQECWLELAAADIDAPILEIGYFGAESAVQFALAKLSDLHADERSRPAQEGCIRLLLDGIRKQTDADGDRFAGYAPVLQAIAAQVASVGNPAALAAKIEGGEERITLESVANAILDREQGKLETLALENPEVRKSLYTRSEQLSRLVEKIYGGEKPKLPDMSASDAETYTKALDTWLPDHPFLGAGMKASTVVFDAMIAAHALRIKNVAAEQRALQKVASSNPFLAEFYIGSDATKDTHIQPEHIGIVYSSMRAQLGLGEYATLTIEGADADNDDEASLTASVEIVLRRKDAQHERSLTLTTDQTGVLRLGNYVEEVSISAPFAHVEIGPGAEAIVVSLVNIQCQKLTISTKAIIAEGLAGGIIYLEAKAFDGPNITSAPTLRNKVSLNVCWPGASQYPWTSYASEPVQVDDPRLDEGLRRFRKFVMSFRSHSKGALGRYKHKLEHERMTKGTGRAVLDHLKQEGILTLHETQYFLDADKLGAVTGAAYADVSAKKFSPQTIAFVRQALAV